MLLLLLWLLSLYAEGEVGVHGDFGSRKCALPFGDLLLPVAVLASPSCHCRCKMTDFVAHFP
jgi:hypothetical protein